MFGMYVQDTDTHKGYVRWVSEDAKGWKPRVFDASITGIMVGGFFGLVYFILVVFGLREMTSAFRCGYDPRFSIGLFHYRLSAAQRILEIQISKFE